MTGGAQVLESTRVLEGVDPASVHGLSAAKFQELFDLTLFDVRSQLIASSADRFSKSGFGDLADLQRTLGRAIRPFSTCEILDFLRTADAAVEGWGYRERDPVARAIMRSVIPNIFAPGSTVEGYENLSLLKGSPIVFLGNHLAALDVHVLDAALNRHSLGAIADRLTAVVGHKTFLFPLLKQVSLSFGTLQVPQSMSVSPRSRELGAREIARGASEVIEAANARLSEGDCLVVFPEGTRSRGGGLQDMLPAISRYVRSADAMIVPWAHWGTEEALPPDTFNVTPAPIHVRFGRPIYSGQLRFLGELRAERAMDTIGFLIADLLPPDRRGAYGEAARLMKSEAAERADAITSPQ